MAAAAAGVTGPLQDVRSRRARDGAQAVEGLLHDGGWRSVSRGRSRSAALPGGEKGARCEHEHDLGPQFS